MIYALLAFTTVFLMGFCAGLLVAMIYLAFSKREEV